MNRATTRGLTALLVLSAASATYAQGWGGSDFAVRIAQRMDGNGDGQIDRDEYDKIQGGFREMLDKKGIRPPLDVQRFGEMLPKLFEEMRASGSFGSRGGEERREGEGDRGGSDRGRGSYDRGREEDRGGDRGSYDRGGDRGSSSSSSSSSSSKPKPKEKVRVTVDIPQSYASADTDSDGQLGLYEWRQWKPAELALFFAMDSNKDGILTARELLIAENFPPVLEGQATPTAAPPVPTSTPVAVRPPSQPDANGNKSGEKPSAEEARYVFKALDKNRDGKIEEAEWKGSKSVREGFEKTGARLRLPATPETFLADYPVDRVVPQMRLR